MTLRRIVQRLRLQKYFCENENTRCESSGRKQEHDHSSGWCTVPGVRISRGGLLRGDEVVAVLLTSCVLFRGREEAVISAWDGFFAGGDGVAVLLVQWEVFWLFIASSRSRRTLIQREIRGELSLAI